MLTRGYVTHTYFPAPLHRTVTDGVVRNVTVKGVPHTWAIARPMDSPASNGAPFYVNGYPNNDVIRGGVQSLSPTRPRVEMDPTNPDTWQRAYRFDG